MSLDSPGAEAQGAGEAGNSDHAVRVRALAGAAGLSPWRLAAWRQARRT